MENCQIEVGSQINSEPLLPVEPRKKFFFVCLCLLFAAEGVDFYSYPMLAITGLSVLYCFYREGYFSRLKEFPIQVYFPIALIAYTAISPGHLLKDLPIADKMLASYLAGLGAVLFFSSRYHLAILCLPASIMASFLFCSVLGFPEDFIGGDRLMLFTGNPNKLSFIAGAGVLIAMLFARQLRGRLRSLIVLVGGVNMVVLILTSSRAAIAATFFCLFFAGLTLLRRHFLKMFAGLMLSIGFIFAFLPASEQQRFSKIFENPMEDANLKQRFVIWGTAVEGIKRSPWLGNSLRSFRSFYADYTTTHHVELERKYGELNKEDPSHPHNVVIGLLFMYGLVGASLCLLAFIPAIRSAFSEPDYFFLSMLLFQFLNGLFDFNLHRVSGLLLLFFPLGVAYGRLAWRQLQVNGGVSKSLA